MGLGLCLVLLPGFAANVGFKAQQMLGGQSSGFGAVMRYFSAFGNRSHPGLGLGFPGGFPGEFGAPEPGFGNLAPSALRETTARCPPAPRALGEENPWEGSCPKSSQRLPACGILGFVKFLTFPEPEPALGIPQGIPLAFPSSCWAFSP